MRWWFGFRVSCEILVCGDSGPCQIGCGACELSLLGKTNRHEVETQSRNARV